MNRIGPKTDPCGIPTIIGKEENFLPLLFCDVNIFLLIKYESL